MRIQVREKGITIFVESGSIFIDWEALQENEWLAAVLIGAVS